MRNTRIERTLRTLLDFQRFAGNRRLERLIRQAEGAYRQTLPDADLEWVSAAGDPAGYIWGEDGHEPG